jgi:hypothetical protein
MTLTNLKQQRAICQAKNIQLELYYEPSARKKSSRLHHLVKKQNIVSAHAQQCSFFKFKAKQI